MTVLLAQQTTDARREDVKGRFWPTSARVVATKTVSVYKDSVLTLTLVSVMMATLVLWITVMPLDVILLSCLMGVLVLTPTILFAMLRNVSAVSAFHSPFRTALSAPTVSLDRLVPQHWLVNAFRGHVCTVIPTDFDPMGTLSLNKEVPVAP